MRKTWGGSEVDIELVEAVNGRETVEAVRLKVSLESIGLPLSSRPTF
jgi:hypothetical protein